MIKITTQPCVVCHRSSELEVEEDKLARYNIGEFVQSIWPDWTADQRELLISGTHPECWDRMFPEEDEK